MEIKIIKVNKKNFCKSQFFFFSFICFVTIFASSCKTTSLLLREKYTDPQVLTIQTLAPQEIIWKQHPSFSDTQAHSSLALSESLEKDVILYTEHIIKSENIKWACVKVDLDKEWEIAVEPTAQTLGKRFYLQQFSKKYNTQVAVNTVPFSNNNNYYLPVSVVKSDGEILCPINSRYAVLALQKIENHDSFSWRANIFASQNEDDLADYDYAFGGFFQILENDTIFPFEKYKRSRTAVGISHDGRFLYFLATCGINQPTGRNGLNFEECALILQKLGCDKAMEFDGGHSSGLTINDENLIRPSLQRKVPAAFGLKLQQ